MYYITPPAKNQVLVQPDGEVLHDRTIYGSERPWREKKLKNEMLANAYEGIDYSKAERLRDCGQYLRFRVYPDGEKRLDMMNSCRVRLCPMCSWRRSLKAFYNTNAVCMELARFNEYRYIMLTLTVRNCTGDALSSQIDALFEAFNRFMGYAAVKKSVKGWMRSLEVTHNVNRESEWFDTYHPHFHLLLCVPKSYFSGKYYIAQKRWAELWQKAARLEYTPSIDVRAIKHSAKHGLVDALDADDLKMLAIADACGEVTKYAVKDADYIIPDDWDLTTETVAVLDQALANRRLIAFGGIMKKIRALLQLEDEDAGDLVNVGEEPARDEVYKLVKYFWYSGARDYYSMKE